MHFLGTVALESVQKFFEEHTVSKVPMVPNQGLELLTVIVANLLSYQSNQTHYSWPYFMGNSCICTVPVYVKYVHFVRQHKFNDMAFRDKTSS